MPTPTKLRAALYNIEDQGYGATPSADTFPTNYTYVDNAVDIEVDLKQEVIKRGLQQLRFVDDPPVYGSKRGTTLSFSVYAHGYSATTPTGAPASLHSLAQLIRSCGYGVTYGGYTTEDSGQTSTSSKVYLTSATGFQEGDGILVTTASGVELTFIAVLDTNTAYVSPALSAAPTDGGAIYGAITLFPLEAGATNQSLKMVCALYDTEGALTLTGGRGSKLTWSMDSAQMMKFDFEFTFQSWSIASHSVADPHTPTVADPVVGMGFPTLYEDSLSWSGAKSTLTNFVASVRTTLHTSNMEFDAGLSVTPRPSTAATQGCAEIILTDRYATLKITPTEFDADYYTDFAAQTAKSFLYQHGSAAGNIVGIYMPSARVMEAPPKPTDIDGIQGLEIMLGESKPYDYSQAVWMEGASADDPQWPTDEAQNSPHRIAFA